MDGRELGDYKILKKVGVGPFGTVFRAEHRFIKKQYILKVLHPYLCQDPFFLSRFEEEVAKLAFLDHPHIVKIHNISVEKDLFYLVTDCILDAQGENRTLDAYLAKQKKPLPEEELLSMTRQIADALDYAHVKGPIVHRALKPGNILIGKAEHKVSVFLTDFGLAKIISPGKQLYLAFQEAAESLKMEDLSFSFLATYSFLAPEQKRNEHVGVQADTFAFGTLVYYMITGQFPEGKFPDVSAIFNEYQMDWDALLSACLDPDPLKRPTQLLPLLGKKRRETSVKNLRQIEDTGKEQSEPLQPKILVEFALKKEETPIYATQIQGLKPVIRQGEELPRPVLEKPEIKTIAVEAKDVSIATAEPITPPSSASYVHSLRSMVNPDPLVTQYMPEKKETKSIEPLQTEMVVIKGGSFFRGSNDGSRDEMPRHKVFVDSFAMDIHPVTNDQFVRFLEYMGDEKDAHFNDLIRLKDSKLYRASGKLYVEPGYGKHPVVGVTWYGAFAYAKWVGKRLPTEAEWEIAARGGLENAPFPTGESIEKSQANFFSSDTTPVSSYDPNGYGIYDMAGNVYEWCQDWYGYNYYETSMQEPHNPKGPLQGVYRVLRGGCWKSLKEDLRTAHRHRNNPGTVNGTYGFRCGADVQPFSL